MTCWRCQNINCNGSCIKFAMLKREYEFAGYFTIEQVKRIEALMMLFEEEEE